MGKIVKFGSESNKGKMKLLHDPKYRLVRRVVVALVALAVLTSGSLLIYNMINNVKNSGSGKVLTIKDLEDPSVDLSPDTSDASVKNLTKELQAKIDRQIAAKENPIDTVKQLAGVLSNTTKQQRQDQLSNFLEDFLTNHEDTMWFEYENEMPDQAQVNYWQSRLYVYMVYNLKGIMDGKYTDSKGESINTVDKQIKYIDLYIKLANDPKSHLSIPEDNRGILVDYSYDELSDFLEIKSSIRGLYDD